MSMWTGISCAKRKHFEIEIEIIPTKKHIRFAFHPRTTVRIPFQQETRSTFPWNRLQLRTRPMEIQYDYLRWRIRHSFNL